MNEPKLQLAFYLASGGDWLDSAISNWDGGRFSHVELVFPETFEDQRKRKIDNLTPPHARRCFSSSPRDGGVRFTWIDLESGRWELVDAPEPDGEASWSNAWERLCYVRDWCEAKVGAKYDYPGIFGFVVPWLIRQNNRRWFCSEICTAALQFAGSLAEVKVHRTSPNKLYQAITGEWPWKHRNAEPPADDTEFGREMNR